MEEFVEGFGGTAQIAGAHCRIVGIGPYFAESLHLQPADEGDGDVGNDVEVPNRNSRSNKHQQYFGKQYRLLAGMRRPLLAEVHNHFGEIDTDGKTDDGGRIFDSAGPVRSGKAHSQMGHIARLAIGEYMPSADIGIGFNEPADNGEQCSEEQSLRLFFGVVLCE